MSRSESLLTEVGAMVGVVRASAPHASATAQTAPPVVLAQAEAPRETPPGREVPETALDEGAEAPASQPAGAEGNAREPSDATQAPPAVAAGDTPAAASEGPSDATIGVPPAIAAQEPPAVDPDAPPAVASEAPGGIGVRVLPLTERAGAGQGAVVTRRLPRIGDPPASPETDAAAPEIRAAAGAAGPQTALARHATAFEAPDGVPLFSVILIDAGAEGLGPGDIGALPFPVTVAVDPTRAGAADRAAAHRQAGREVVLLAEGLPEGALPSDVEVALGASLAAVPDVIGVMDTIEGRLAGGLDLARQAAAVLGEEGHGLVLWDRGLNSAAGAATAGGVETGLVFRLLDRDRERAIVIGRYLDRAAFKAAQEGSVIMVGHTYPETVSALAAWALEGRGREVALAPVSAILLAP